jgi:hypothetical protein
VRKPHWRLFERLASDVTVSAHEQAIEQIETFRSHDTIQAGWGSSTVCG